MRTKKFRDNEPTASRPPTLQDAHEIAQMFVEREEARKVMLHGSVADGTATPSSDIDMIAVFDDLDYEERICRESDMKFRARYMTGYQFDVLVTDRPEWKHRSTVVFNSFEYRIAPRTKTLIDLPVGEVHWDKTIGFPATVQTEIDRQMSAVAHGLRGMSNQHLEPRAASFVDAAFVCAHGALVADQCIKSVLAARNVPPPHILDENLIRGLLPERLWHLWDSVPATMTELLSAWRRAATFREEIYETSTYYSKDAIELAACQYLRNVGTQVRCLLDEYERAYNNVSSDRERLLELLEPIKNLAHGTENP